MKKFACALLMTIVLAVGMGAVPAQAATPPPAAVSLETSELVAAPLPTGATVSLSTSGVATVTAADGTVTTQQWGDSGSTICAPYNTPNCINMKVYYVNVRLTGCAACILFAATIFSLPGPGWVALVGMGGTLITCFIK